jgi:hypothetical protein
MRQIRAGGANALFVAWNTSFRYPESDILMDKCGRKEQICDIVEIDDGQMTFAFFKSSKKALEENICV